MLFKDIELYEALIVDEKDGILAISLVDYPAVESDFVCFKDEKKLVRFAVENEEQRIISGVVMLADVPIYRRAGDYEYYIIYSKDTIKKMAEKMLSDGTFKQNDLQHNGEYIKGLNLLELYIKDDSRGLSPNYVTDIPDGSLMASFKVEDDALWDEVKNGDALNGFSLEGFFTIEKVDNNKINIQEMSKIKKFAQSLMSFEEIETENGKLFWGEGELAVGTEVYTENEEGEKVAAADGEYISGEKTITVADGKVSEIRIQEEDPGEEEVIVISASKEKFNKVKAAFEESYEDKERKIAEAVRAKGFDAWIVEAGDGYAIAEVWSDEAGDYKHYRFDVSWDEAGNAIVSDPVEVVSEFVPKEEVVTEPETPEEVVENFEDQTVEPEPEVRDEKEERISKLEEDLAEIKNELAAVKASLEEIVNKPVAQPIAEEFAQIKTSPKNVNKSAKLFASVDWSN